MENPCSSISTEPNSIDSDALFTDEIFTILENLAAHKRYDEVESILWRLRSSADQMSQFYKNMHIEFVVVADKLDN